METSLFDPLLGYWTPQEIGANINVFFNIFGALVLGLFVGYERSYRGRAAGMRTYGLVCMASCALTVITGEPQFWYGGHTPIAVSAIDPGRVVQGITTGVGFLGAGVIMRNGMSISGLTTAASIWAVAAIGILVGVGFYSAAIMMSVISTIFMMWGSKLENLLPSRHAIAVTLRLTAGADFSETELTEIVHAQGYEVAKGSFSIDQREGRFEVHFVAVSLGRRKGATLIKLGKSLSKEKGVADFHISHARN